MRIIDLSVASVLAFAVLTHAAPAGAHGPKAASPVTAPLSRTASAAAMVVDAFHSALQRGDTEAAAACLATDALIYESGSAERSMAEYAAHHLAADAGFAKVTTRLVTNRAAHTVGDFAWIATESITSGTYKDHAINSKSTETMVLFRQNGSWKIEHVHWSSADAN